MLLYQRPEIAELSEILLRGNKAPLPSERERFETLASELEKNNSVSDIEQAIRRYRRMKVNNSQI